MQGGCGVWEGPRVRMPDKLSGMLGAAAPPPVWGPPFREESSVRRVRRHGISHRKGLSGITSVHLRVGHTFREASHERSEPLTR